MIRPTKPTCPPPPVPGERRPGANVDADGKRSRLPGDTVRQVITPGRIRNLACMFDKQAQVETDPVTTPARKPRSAARRATRDIFFTPTGGSHDENNNGHDHHPPRKPLRSFVTGFLPEEDLLSQGDFNVSEETPLPRCNLQGALEEALEEDEDELPAVDNEKDEEEQAEEPQESEDKEDQVQLDNPVEEIQVETPVDDSRLGEEVLVPSSEENQENICLEEQDSTPKVSMLLDEEIYSRVEPAKRTRTLSSVQEHHDDIAPQIVLPVQRSRTYSRGDEQSVNGHIDNLFDFVEEHLSSKQSRSSRECLFQPHFSPTAIPNIAELSQDCTLHAKSQNSKSSKRVGSALATSTPHNSYRHAPLVEKEVPTRLIDNDISFVSSIQDTSQAEAVTQYEQLIIKNEHALERNNQQITMLQKALAQARKERKPMQEVNAQKSLLVVRERVVLLQREIKRLKALVACRRPIPNQCLEVRGSLTISNVAIHLNRNFYTKPYEMATNYSFLVMLKCGCEVECTATHNLLAHQSSRLKVVHFDEKINFCNLPVDFCVMLEVYAMAIPERESGISCASIIASKCRNLLPKERVPMVSPSGFPYGEFVRCGYVQLTRDTTGTTKFYLDEVEYPLDGTIELTTHCTTLPPAIAIDHEGFLTMYQCISGMSSWERYWAVLRRGTILFWKYPEDERMNRAAKARLDLSTCSQYEVHPCSVDQCPRPYTFAVNVLVNTAPSVMDKKRIFLAADSRAEMKNWLENINETLTVLRGQHPYKGSILPRN